MLQNIQNQRVHILSPGFEFNWIIESFNKSRPDKIYLMRKPDKNEKAAKVIEEIKKFAKRTNAELEIIKSDGDVYDMIKETKRIFELENGNLIYLSISSGERDYVSAFILASMLFCRSAKEVHLYSLKEGEFIDLPHFEVKLPKPEVIEAIKFVGEKRKCIKRDLKKHMFDNKLLVVENKSKFEGHNQYVKLNRSVLDSAIDWGLIKIEGKRKGSRIYLTEEGEKWFKIFK